MEIFLFIIAAGVIAHLIGASVHEGIFVGALVSSVSCPPLMKARGCDLQAYCPIYAQVDVAVTHTHYSCRAFRICNTSTVITTQALQEETGKPMSAVIDEMTGLWPLRRCPCLQRLLW